MVVAYAYLAVVGDIIKSNVGISGSVRTDIAICVFSSYGYAVSICILQEQMSTAACMLRLGGPIRSGCRSMVGKSRTCLNQRHDTVRLGYARRKVIIRLVELNG